MNPNECKKKEENYQSINYNNEENYGNNQNKNFNKLYNKNQNIIENQNINSSIFNEVNKNNIIENKITVNKFSQKNKSSISNKQINSAFDFRKSEKYFNEESNFSNYPSEKNKMINVSIDNNDEISNFFSKDKIEEINNLKYSKNRSKFKKKNLNSIDYGKKTSLTSMNRVMLIDNNFNENNENDLISQIRGFQLELQSEKGVYPIRTSFSTASKKKYQKYCEELKKDKNDIKKQQRNKKRWEILIRFAFHIFSNIINILSVLNYIVQTFFDDIPENENINLTLIYIELILTFYFLLEYFLICYKVKGSYVKHFISIDGFSSLLN